MNPILTNSGSRRRCKWFVLSCCLLMLCLESFAAVAQSVDQEALERQVKAAYLYKFGSYVEWPERVLAASDGTLRIGILGSPVLAEELEQMVAGRTLQGRQISVHKLRQGDALGSVHILFISRSNNDRLAETLAMVRGQPILTVSEAENGLAQGSMVNLVNIGGRLRFEVSPKAAQQGRLTISARLLSAALKVAGGS